MRLKKGTIVVRIGNELSNPRYGSIGAIFATLRDSTDSGAPYGTSSAIYKQDYRLATDREIIWYKSDNIENISEIPQPTDLKNFSFDIDASAARLRRYRSICLKYGIPYENVWSGDTLFYGVASNGMPKASNMSFGVLFNLFSDFKSKIQTINNSNNKNSNNETETKDSNWDEIFRPDSQESSGRNHGIPGVSKRTKRITTEKRHPGHSQVGRISPKRISSITLSKRAQLH